MFCDILRRILTDKDDMLINIIPEIVENICSHAKCKELILDMINNDSNINNMWSYNLENGKVEMKCMTREMEHDYGTINEFKFTHKCLAKPNNDGEGNELNCNKESGTNNFELVITDTDSDTELQPTKKKTKLDSTSDIDTILNRLMQDTMSLCSIKDNVFTSEQNKKIIYVCDKLRNILK